MRPSLQILSVCIPGPCYSCPGLTLDRWEVFPQTGHHKCTCMLFQFCPKDKFSFYSFCCWRMVEGDFFPHPPKFQDIWWESQSRLIMRLIYSLYLNESPTYFIKEHIWLLLFKFFVFVPCFLGGHCIHLVCTMTLSGSCIPKAWSLMKYFSSKMIKETFCLKFHKGLTMCLWLFLKMRL